MNILDILINAGISRPRSGAQNRYYNLTTQVTRRGHVVVVLEPAEYEDAHDNEVTRVRSYKDLRLFHRTLCSFRDLAPNYVRTVNALLHEYDVDLIQLSHPSGALAAALVARVAGKPVPLIYAPHNVESLLITETFAHDRRYTWLERHLVPAYFWALEKLVCRFIAASIVTVSERDRELLVQTFALDPHTVHVIPSGCTLTPLPDEDARIRARAAFGISGDVVCILFHGWYAYAPNKEAFDLIETVIAPQVERSHPEARFILAGTDAPVFEKANVKALGFVDDLARVIAAADIAIVPLQHGSGTKLKVFDYMNGGLPIVATRKAMEGIAATDGQDALIAPTAGEELVDRLRLLLDDERERRRIGANGRRLLEARYTWDASAARLVQVYAEVLGSACS